jgi:hypothetical protein
VAPEPITDEDWKEIPEGTVFGAAADITTATRSLLGSPAARQVSRRPHDAGPEPWFTSTRAEYSTFSIEKGSSRPDEYDPQ